MVSVDIRSYPDSSESGGANDGERDRHRVASHDVSLIASGLADHNGAPDDVADESRQNIPDTVGAHPGGFETASSQTAIGAEAVRNLSGSPVALDSDTDSSSFILTNSTADPPTSVAAVAPLSSPGPGNLFGGVVNALPLFDLTPTAASHAGLAQTVMTASNLTDFTGPSSLAEMRSVLLPEPETHTISSASARAMNVTTATSIYGVTGAGITIGIVSDSFNDLGGAASDERNGNLPSASGVTVLHDMSGGTDEGRAMAQLIHLIAPDAHIDFYTCGDTVNSMGTAITALQSAGANIIVDDIGFEVEPFYQITGPIDSAIDSFVGAGGVYFTAAGNASNSFYEAIFNSYTTTVSGVGHKTFENFGTNATPSAIEKISVPAFSNAAVVVEWAQPYNTPTSVLNIHVTDSSGNVISDSSQYRTSGFAYSWIRSKTIPAGLRPTISRCHLIVVQRPASSRSSSIPIRRRSHSRS